MYSLIHTWLSLILKMHYLTIANDVLPTRLSYKLFMHTHITIIFCLFVVVVILLTDKFITSGQGWGQILQIVFKYKYKYFEELKYIIQIQLLS